MLKFAARLSPTVKNSRREVPPVLPELPGLVMETGTTPGDDTSKAGTVTVMLVSLPETRFSLTVPKFTQASDWKFSPKIVRLNAPDPAVRLAGLKGFSARMIGMPAHAPDRDNKLDFVRVAPTRRWICHYHTVGAAARNAHRCHNDLIRADEFNCAVDRFATFSLAQIRHVDNCQDRKSIHGSM